MAKPNVVRNAPSLLHAVALVGPTHATTVRNIRNMERATPPALYEAATQIVTATLKRITLGTTNRDAYDWAKAQAKAVTKPDVRKCAEQVIAHLRPYLLATTPKWFRPIDVEYFQIGTELQVPVKVAGLMLVGGRPTVLVLHLWRKPLEIEQRRAAAAILKNRLGLRDEFREADLDFVDISVPLGKREREFRRLAWTQASPFSDQELDEFSTRLHVAWLEYLTDPEPPKARKPKADENQGDMFAHAKAAE